VEAVNERGIKINDGWLNVSKFHAVALPMRGALVTLEVQGAGFSAATCSTAL
jgi:hypothetical protein